MSIGAVLFQNIEDVEIPIAYATHTMSKAGRKYCVIIKKFLGVVYFTKYFELVSVLKAVNSTHRLSSIRWLLKFRNHEGQLGRLRESLSVFSLTIEHRPGEQSANTDVHTRKS